jgi:N-methylhydantoinase B
MSTKIDPILLSVYARTFKSITDEMSISMEQTTRSPILCEAKDYVTGLYDADGNMLEQTENLPILAFSLAPVCKYIKEYFGDEIYPGDVIFHNDVFSLGNQNNDVAAFKPVFFEDKLVAWTAVKGHQADIGGNVAGGYNPNAVEVWQEALRIPPVKVVERGKLRKDVWNLIFANVRLDIVQHDMKAEMGACTVGERRLLELLKKYGVESYEAHKQALFDATRKMMEAEIAKIPNGNYSGEGYVYFDGRFVGSKYTIRVDIEVKDKHIKFDYSRTDPQTNGFVNGTFTSSASATILTLLQMVNPDIPHNEGMVQPIEIVIPERHDTQCGLPEGHHLRQPPLPAQRRRHPARAGPGDARPRHRRLEQPAGSLTTGIDPGNNEKYVDIGFMGLKGGSGAMRGTDGYDHIGMIDASGGVLDQDYEMFEQQTPHTPDQARTADRFGRRRRMARRARRRDHLQDRLRRHATGDLRRRRLRAGLRPLRRRRRRPQFHPPALPRRPDRGAEEQGPDHRRTHGHHLPPGRQRRRRLRRSEEARPQAAGRGDPQWRDHSGGGCAGLRVQRVNAEMKPSCATVSARSRRQGALLRSMSPSLAFGQLLLLYLRGTGHPTVTIRKRHTGFRSKAEALPARGVGCPIPAGKGGGLRAAGAGLPCRGSGAFSARGTRRESDTRHPGRTRP